ncbi:MAG: hypothetical protein ABIV04_12175 [Massilia sp.]
MDIQEDPVVSHSESVTRFAFGAILGICFGIYLVAKLSLEAPLIFAFTVLGSIGASGYLALRYGDEFWYAIFGNHS